MRALALLLTLLLLALAAPASALGPQDPGRRPPSDEVKGLGPGTK
ncbi:hypothetical protein [Thermus sp.]|nr:hypothetical protein [Thermus sp.]MDW8358631.1 hypothetical protein [Thermus sp.]